MYIKAATILEKNKDCLSRNVSNWVKNNYPYRTTELLKCQRDLEFIIDALVQSLKENNETHIEILSSLFFKNGLIELKSTHVEFIAYDVLLDEIKKIFIDVEEHSVEFTKQLLINLKNNLTQKTSISKILEKRKAVKEFETKFSIPDIVLNSLLERTWKVTPSKNQFMPYTVHVLGPKHQTYKNLIYQLCLNNEQKNDKIQAGEQQERYGKELPFYANIMSCSHLLVFTLRVEDNPSEFQKFSMSKGHKFEAVCESTIENLYPTASLEVGMFSNVLGTLCLENNIDVSYILCFTKKLENWKEIPFVTRLPILLMPIGKGKVYRMDILKKHGIFEYDLRPEYSRIVNFIKE